MAPVNYFTEWVEAASICKFDKRTGRSFHQTKHRLSVWLALIHYSRQCAKPQQRHDGCLMCIIQDLASEFNFLQAQDEWGS